MHGYHDLQPELTKLSKESRWAAMGDAIDDELLHLVAVVGEPESVGADLAHRWSDVYDRLSLYAPYEVAPEVLHAVAAAVRQHAG